MEDFSFRPSYEVEKVPSSFLSSALTYLDSLDHTKASLKPEPLLNSLQVNQEYRRHRLNSYENPMFFPFKDDEHFPNMQDQLKAEAFGQDFANFAHHPQAEFGFDFNMAKGLQDYAVDYYRINRSRGPSFHIGPGRKMSEDLFAHGFDLLNLQRNLEQHSQEQHDARTHPTFLDAPLIHQGLAGNFNSLAENNYHNNLQIQFENAFPKEFMLNNMANTIQQQAQALQQPAQEEEQEPSQSEMEPKTQKKRKTNNNKEITAKQEAEAPSIPSLKKSKSENKKASKTDVKASKTMEEKPVAKKAGSKSKKGQAEEHGVKEEKSTEASTTVSPVTKKEELPGLFNSKSSIVGTFGHFKQPETAQELLGGLSLPAEVEEYINNSKIFHQIKAPIMKKIGTLTLEERRVKIEKYLEKRKRRSWNKRVNYDCRKKVADNRLRIKGRFVTRDQAFSMLEAIGIYPDPEKITMEEIKEILTSRFGGVLKKKEATGEQGAANAFKGNTQELNFGEEENSFDQDDE